MVTGRRPIHLWADGVDDTRPLVPGNDRKPLSAQVPVREMEVRMADAGRGHPHEHLASTRRVELDFLDAGRRAGLV
jgi:hypothetical protein